MQSDFYGDVPEENNIYIYLDMVFPPPWNSNYTPENVKVFYLTDGNKP
jgi:hypothetical protein